MNIAVRYVTRSGNTKKVADAIAQAAGVQAQDCAAALTEPVDLLFLGGSIYGGGIDQSLRQFIDLLDSSQVKCVATFGTSALKKEPDREVEKRLKGRGITVLSQGFHCRGEFTVMHRGRPNEADLKKAAEFANAAVEVCGSTIKQ